MLINVLKGYFFSQIFKLNKLLYYYFYYLKLVCYDANMNLLLVFLLYLINKSEIVRKYCF